MFSNVKIHPKNWFVSQRVGSFMILMIAGRINAYKSKQGVLFVEFPNHPQRLKKAG